MPPIDKQAIRDRVAAIDLISQRLFWDDLPEFSTSNDGDYELGMSIQSDVPGRITAVRYFRPVGETGTHVGKVWDATSKQLLAQVTFTNESVSGWQQAALATPLSISANKVYVVSVNANKVYPILTPRFNTNNNEIQNVQVDFGALHTAPTNKYIFNYNPGVFPGDGGSKSYLRDVVFQADTAFTAQATQAALPYRVKLALFLALLHPSYLVQK